jgi:MraZ protein
MEQNLRTLSSYDPAHRLFIRALLEKASESQLDGQARISIPHDLREFAAIKGEVRIIGTLDKIELWDPKTYDEYMQTQSETYESIAAKVMR